MNTKPFHVLVGLGLLAGAAFASSPSASNADGPVSKEPMKAFSYNAQSQPASPTLPTSNLTSAPTTTTLSSRSLRDLDEEVTLPPLTAQRALATHDLAGRTQLFAVGAPASPIPGESRSEAEQVRVPLLGVDW